MDGGPHARTLSPPLIRSFSHSANTFSFHSSFFCLKKMRLQHFVFGAKFRFEEAAAATAEKYVNDKKKKC